jgi:hypothetical protein
MSNQKCKTCGSSEYGSAHDCGRTATKMLVDTCATARGRGGYCAAHPSDLAMDSGSVHATRASAARAYAAAEWQCDPADVRVRKSAGRYGCRYIATRGIY